MRSGLTIEAAVRAPQRPRAATSRTPTRKWAGASSSPTSAADRGDLVDDPRGRARRTACLIVGRVHFRDVRQQQPAAGPAVRAGGRAPCATVRSHGAGARRAPTGALTPGATAAGSTSRQKLRYTADDSAMNPRTRSTALRPAGVDVEDDARPERSGAIEQARPYLRPRSRRCRDSGTGGLMRHAHPRSAGTACQRCRGPAPSGRRRSR